MKLEDRFWSKVNKIDDSNSCWEWQGFCYPTGHGQFHLDRRDIKASRASWLIFVGPLESGDYVCHRCHNPRCVRPSHLYKGTHATNQHDEAVRGSRKNEKGHNVKLDWNKVLKIRAMRDVPAPLNRNNIRGRLPRGFYSSSQVAELFGVSSSTVMRIWNEADRGGWRKETLVNG